MSNPSPAIRRGAVVPLLACLVAAAACGGGGNGTTDPPPPEEARVLAVGVVRLDESPNQPLTGFLTFFFDLDEQRLLSADARVGGLALADSVLPGIVPGPLYIRPASDRTVAPGTVHRLEATVRTPTGERVVTSSSVTVPAGLDLRFDDPHPRGSDLRIEWDPPADASGINVAVGSGFEEELPASADGITVPANAFAGLGAGATIEIEVTTFNAFFVSISGGISSLGDAEAFARRFTAADDNVEGATGAFGAATTVGAILTLQ